MIRMQLKIMFSRWEFWLVFLGSMVFALYAVYVAKHTPISYCSAEYQYMGNNFSTSYSIFITLFPFLVVVPFATSLIDDISKRSFAAMTYRSSVNKYLLGKYIATFVGNVLIVLIPFLFNLLLCYMIFPINNSNPFGDEEMLILKIMGATQIYQTLSKPYPFAVIFLQNHLLFYLAYLLIFSMVSGIFGVFVLSISVWIRKYRILLFLPLFILVRLSNVISINAFNAAVDAGLEGRDRIFVNLELSDYLAPFGLGGVYYPFFIIFLLVLLLFSVLSYFYFCKKEYLYV